MTYFNVVVRFSTVPDYVNVIGIAISDAVKARKALLEALHLDFPYAEDFFCWINEERTRLAR